MIHLMQTLVLLTIACTQSVLSLAIDRKNHNAIYEKPTDPTSWPNCGEVNFHLGELDNLSNAELPFMAMIYRDKPLSRLIHKRFRYDRVPIGAATILTPQYLLTTAHQFLNLTSDDLHDLTVGVGSSDYLKQTEFHRISAVRIHKLSHPTTFLYDVALVKLARPLTFGPQVGAACLSDEAFQLVENWEMVAEWDLAPNQSNSFLYTAQSKPEFWFDCAKNHMNFGAWDGHDGPQYPIECSNRPVGAHRCLGNYGSVLLKRTSDNQIVIVGLGQRAKHHCGKSEVVTYTQVERLSKWMYHAIWDMTKHGGLTKY